MCHTSHYYSNRHIVANDTDEQTYGDQLDDLHDSQGTHLQPICTREPHEDAWIRGSDTGALRVADSRCDTSMYRSFNRSHSGTTPSLFSSFSRDRPKIRTVTYESLQYTTDATPVANDLRTLFHGQRARSPVNSPAPNATERSEIHIPTEGLEHRDTPLWSIPHPMQTLRCGMPGERVRSTQPGQYAPWSLL